jgi:hypothetical protein
MAYAIPASWQVKSGSAGQWLLSDWTTAQGDADSAYWVEQVGKISPSVITAHFASPSAAEMIFLTDYNSVADTDVLQDLTLSIIGGYDESSGVMYTPFACPYNTNLFATDLEIKPAYLDNTNANSSGTPSAYRVGVCRVGFQGLPYDVDVPQTGNPYNPNWIEIRPSAANQQFTAPSNYYNFSSGTQSGQTAALGTIYIEPLTYFDVILHRVPAQPFFQLSSGKAQLYCGYLNNATFMGAATKQLLLQSMDMGDGSFGDYAGNLICSIHMHFIFNANTWNTALDNTGAWSTIVTAVGSNAPFTAVAMNTLMNLLLPAQG